VFIISHGSVYRLARVDLDTVEQFRRSLCCVSVVRVYVLINARVNPLRSWLILTAEQFLGVSTARVM
jgi:hypothetical protein